MIFSPSTGAYKQVGGFKAIFDIFPSTWSWEVLDYHSFIINYAWSNEPIKALDEVMLCFLYEIISGKTKW
jgi:regulator of sigma E protease